MVISMLATRGRGAMAQDEKRECPLWEVVSLEQRELPRASQASQARRRWQALGRWLTLGSEAGEEPARDEAQLERLPRVRLANLAPPIDWQPGARALAHHLAVSGESAGGRKSVV